MPSDSEEQARKDRISRWKDKLKLSIDEDGNLLYGWGYPQTAHISALNKLNASDRATPDLDEVFRFLDKEIGEEPSKAS